MSELPIASPYHPTSLAGPSGRGHRAGLTARLAAALPAAGVLAGCWVLAAHQPAHAAVETRYLALVAGAVLAGAAWLAPRLHAPALAAVLAATLLWATPAGPGRGAALGLLLVAATAAAASGRLALGRWDLLAWLGGALTTQAMLRGHELLPADLAWGAVVRLVLPPAAAAVALWMLGAADGDDQRRATRAGSEPPRGGGEEAGEPVRRALATGVAAALPAAGLTATAALPLLALAIVDEAAERGWRRLPRGRAGLALVLLLALGVLRPRAGGLALAVAVVAALHRARRPGWALGAAALPLLLAGGAAVARGGPLPPFHDLALLPLLVPALVVPWALGWQRWPCGLLLAAGGVALLPAPPGLAAGAALLAWWMPARGELMRGEPIRGELTRGAPGRGEPTQAAPIGVAQTGVAQTEVAPIGVAPTGVATRRALAGAMAAVQRAWWGILLVLAALAGGYPWLRREPWLGALDALGAPADWWGAAAVATGALVLAGAGVGWARARRALAPAPGTAFAAERGATRLTLVAVTVALCVALPPPHRDLLGGQQVRLRAGTAPWSRDWARSVCSVRIESLLANSTAAGAGTEVAMVELLRGGRVLRAFPLRVGVETAEWAAERPDLRGRVPLAPHRLSWLPPPGDAFAHAYRAGWRTEPCTRVDRVRVRPTAGLPPGAELVLRRVELAR